VSFVGHTKSTTVARWNPKMFVKNGGEVENVKEHYSVCAMGGLDCTVTVWTTSSNRAKLVVEEVFREAVLDLTWSPDGLSLFAASHDGSILVVSFDEESLGITVPDKLNAVSTGDDEIIENALIMKMLEKQKQKEEEAGQDVQEEEVEVDEGPSEAVELPPQTEVVVNGRRRIIPVRIPSPVKRVKRRIKPKSFSSKKPLPGLSIADSNVEKKVDPGGSGTPVALRNKAKLLDRMGGSGAQSGFDKTKLLDGVGGSASKAKLDKASKLPSSVPFKVKPITVLPGKKKGALKSQEKNLKRSIPYISSPSQPSKKRKIIDLDGPVEEKSVRYLTKPAVMLVDPTSFSSRKFISAKLDLNPATGNASDLVTILEARILSRRRYSGENIYTALTCLKGDRIIWKGEVEGHASVLAGNRMFSAVGTLEGKLYLFSRAGSFLKLPLTLSSEVVSLSLNRKNELLGMTNDGKGHVWRINPSVGELSECCFDFDIAALLRQPSKTGAKPSFATAWITDSMKVLISCKDKTVFILDRAMRTWATVSDGSYWGSNIRPGRIAQVETSAASSAAQPASLKAIQHKFAPERHPFDLANLSDKDAHLHTLLYLERQIAASQAMDVRDEYASWTMQYMSFLVDSVGDDESLLDRLRESCEKLLCAYAEDPEEEIEVEEQSSCITPIFKRGLLRKALPRLMSNPSLRSLVSRLAKDLEQQEKSNSV